jgi:hypothetical protein
MAIDSDMKAGGLSQGTISRNYEGVWHSSVYPYFERLFRVCGSLTILTDRRRACRLCITEAKRGYNPPPVLEPLHGYVFSPTHYCERGRGKLSERRSISAQQVAEPQVMTRRAELKFG